jgi:hypothetical protein
MTTQPTRDPARDEPDTASMRTSSSLTSRQRFLRGSAVIGGLAASGVAGHALADSADNLPPHIPEWMTGC